MKKHKFIFIVLIFIFCMINTNFSSEIFADTIDTSINIRAYGDSISAGYGLEDYENYNTNKTSAITKDCYAEVFSNDLINIFGGNVKGFGVSGNNSTDLVDLLQPYNDNTATDMQEFEDTDIIALCIGANNVLGTATNNIQNYILGQITNAQYRELLQHGVDSFKVDYLKILQTFEGKKIVVMTVYNPYKYTSFLDVTVNVEDDTTSSLINTTLYAIDEMFQEMLSTTMEYLQMINEEIRNSASENICVVDVWNLFENFSEEEYKQYINSDISKVEISNFDISNIAGSINLDDLSKNCDPHPTKAGHNVIAQEHIKTFKYISIKTQSNLTNITEKNVSINIIVQNPNNEQYVYKLYKDSGTKILLAENSTGEFFVVSNDINGTGNLFVEVYKDSQKIYTTNSLSYGVNISGDEDTNDGETEPPSTNTSSNQNEEGKTILVACFVGLLVVSLCVVAFIVVKSSKNRMK